MLGPILWISLMAAAPKVDATEGPFFYEKLRVPAYYHTFHQLFRGKQVPAPWVKRYLKYRDGVDTPSKTVTIENGVYELYSICKPHECPGNVLTVLFEPGGRKAWAYLTLDDGTSLFYGNPRPEMKEGLRALVE